MAKSKRSPRRPQPRHKTRRQPSRHDRRSRLDHRNPERKKTERARFPLVGLFASLVAILQSAMDWIAHQCLENELSSVLGEPPDAKKFRDRAESLFRICL